MYKPTVEDILWAKDVNDRLIKTQTYNPIEIKEAYRKLFGEEPTNQHFARSKVFTYFQYNYVEIPVVDIPVEIPVISDAITSTIGTMENLPMQSHSEDANDDLADKPKPRGRKKKE